MTSEQPYWFTCDHDGCIGSRVANRWCLAHAAEHARDHFDAALKRIGATGTVDARGVVISADLLERLLDAAPRKGDEAAVKAAQFDQATFVEGRAWFSDVTFEGRARFNEATFEDQAVFAEVTFEGEAGFNKATFKDEALFAAAFKGEARFDEATFKDAALFGKRTFEGEAVFDRATFEGEASFREAIFRRKAEFDGATFQGDAEFAGATFQNTAKFNEATFDGAAQFERATFEDVAGFASATFEQAQQFGPTVVRKQLVLDQAIFKQRVQVEVGAAAVCCRRTQFPAGVQLRLRWASVVLDDADLAGTSILAGAPPFADLDEARFAWAWDERARPRLLSAHRADLAGLTVSDVDLRVCRFLGAHNLERLRVDTLRAFGFTPQGWRVVEGGRAWPPIWRWSPRYTLFEENCWRAQHERRLVRHHGWHSTVNADWSDAYDRKVPKRRIEKSSTTPRERQDAAQEIANLYRALRKGREDSKDEPGAADLYYGEMEMRRKATAPLSVERWVLTLYWLVSGYALRASRAMISLILAVVLAALLFANVGFPAQQASPATESTTVTRQGTSQVTGWKQYLDALAYSLESTTSLLRPPDQALTRPGRWVQIVLRLVGPLLFGLTILSLRGRIKR
jgi:uncharacterized protein YjbI with pentapeptide repeats